MDRHMIFPSTSEKAQTTLTIIMDEVEKLHQDGSFQLAVRMGLEEALANAVKHGNQRDSSKKVRVHAIVTPDLVQLEIEDEGIGFDPNSVPDPTLPENLEKPSGRGIWLMRHYMDHVQFNNLGNKVELSKFARHSVL
ncbi:MAG: ATP-binding protein [Acidobacteriota bacterium]